MVSADDEPDRPAEVDDRVVAARAGDEAAFAELFEQHRREIRVHCYRMVGSFTDAEDLVQDTFLQAWRRLDTFEGRSTFRAWLYKIATNRCLDVLKRRPQRYLPFDVMAPIDPDGVPKTVDGVAWIEPFPDALLAPASDDPGAATIESETVELAFLAAIQYLLPRQRAVLVLRDVLGWPASEVASLLEITEAAVKSTLQRARPIMRERFPRRRDEWAPETQPDDAERVALRRYMDALERDDVDALARLLAEDVRVAYPQIGIWCDSRDAFINGSRRFAPPGDYRVIPAAANGQPALAIYLRSPGAPDYQITALEVIRVDGGRIVEIVDYDLPDLYPAFGLAPTLPG